VSPIEPFEPFSFEVKVDAGLARIPLDEVITEIECQSAEFVPPCEVNWTPPCDVQHNAGHGFFTERV